ncbi:MAG: ArnT family glycosyltransferase, partial [Candidatus Kapaibacteriota bacterium]
MYQKDILPISFSAFILAIILLAFNIQRGEVQPWDEGLYAYRAREILNTNLWWDQTSASLGNLYSSTYPPLVPWIMALNMKFFGVNLFSIRLFSILSSAGIIFLFLLCISRCFDSQTSFLISINLLLSTHWFTYSRQGMLDIPLLFFIFSNLLAVLNFLQSNTRTKEIFYGILIALTFCFALMTKIVLSFIPLLFLIFIHHYFKGKKFKVALLFFAIGFLASLPWYISMSFKYGSAFLFALFPPHLYSIVEGNTKPLGLLYYLNQLVISNPILSFSFLNVLVRLKSFKQKSFFSQNFLSDIFFFWFIFGTIIFSLAPTKMQYYTLYLLIPAFYLSLEFVTFNFDKQKLPFRFFSMLIFVLTILWYFSPEIRASLKELNPIYSVKLLFASLIVVLLGIIYWFEKHKRLISLYCSKSVNVVIFLISVAILFTTLLDREKRIPGVIFGGERTSTFLKQHKVDTLVYLFHKVNDSDTLNPQLAWYTEGFYFGKDRSKKIIFLPIPSNKIGLEEIKWLNKYPNYYVVYYIYSKNVPKQILISTILTH